MARIDTKVKPSVLLATDAAWVHAEVEAALGAPDMPIRWVRHGSEVPAEVAKATPTLVLLDMQVGNMGGIATCMALRLDAGVGRLPQVPILILLDRTADVFLARRSGADGWMIKPLDALRLREAANRLRKRGGTYTEGIPAELPA
ncbi:MAG: response regulator [Acidimicrobiia bacterium]